MKEGDWVLQQANEIVLKKEERDFTALFLRTESARKQAEGCKCFQCRRRYERLQQELDFEAWRLDASRYHPDHEEDWIAEQAIKTLKKNQRKTKNDGEGK